MSAVFSPSAVLFPSSTRVGVSCSLLTAPPDQAGFLMGDRVKFKVSMKHSFLLGLFSSADSLGNIFTAVSRLSSLLLRLSRSRPLSD